MKPRVILIRENAETLTCSSCAGTLEGIDAFGSRQVPDYEGIRKVMGRAGTLYQALRQKYGEEVEIDVVDPRNTLYLIPTLVTDYRRYRPALRDFLKALLFGVTPSSVIINGRAVHVGELPSPDVLVEEVGHVLLSPSLT